jgi:3-methylfumaryl-CoA hydratase
MIEPRDGVGTPISRSDVCSIGAARRVAAMLDQDPDSIAEGDPLPRGWQFILMAADARRSSLRSDGFPGLGVAMPDLGFPRLMLGGRTVEFHQDIAIGSEITRTSSIQSLTHKSGASGPFSVATIAHHIRTAGQLAPAIVETQTYILMGEAKRAVASDDGMQPVVASVTKVFTPDATLLFQFSALGFNSHKIHLDPVYAREVEGFPGLVVNGGLATLLLTEFARNDLQLKLQGLKTKHLAPLFCDRPMTLAADRVGESWTLRVHDEQGRLALSMEVQ